MNYKRNTTRRTGRILIGFLLMLLTFATASAQTDVASLNEENKQLQEELKTLTERQKALSDSVKTQEGQLKSLTADIKKEEKALTKNKDKNKSPELQKRQAELQASIEDYIKKVQEKGVNIYQLDQRLNDLKKRRQNLVSIRDDVGKDFIQRHREYVEQAFSKMKTDKLTAIKTECGQYGDDKNVKEFAKQVEKVISMKLAYDNAAKVVAQRFSRTDVEQALNALPASGFNSVQTEEINTMRTELQGFESGLNTFKEFINALAKKRAAIVSRSDLDDELDIILGKNNLKERIKKEVETVPYLKDRYNEYIKAIHANPNKQPAIEKEILDQ